MKSESEYKTWIETSMETHHFLWTLLVILIIFLFFLFFETLFAYYKGFVGNPDNYAQEYDQYRTFRQLVQGGR
jgi:hypothetical protein